HDMGIRQVSPVDFLKKQFDAPVFTQLYAQDYVRHRDRLRIFNKEHFYAHGEEYVSVFAPYAAAADIFINAIYYDPKAPAFFTPEEMSQTDFRIRVIADITCDIAPESSVPSTLRACTIADPVFGYDPVKRAECAPFSADAIDVMAIDNLPSELPRDASDYFGRQLAEHVIPEFFKAHSARLERACITEDGKLTPRYSYLSDYVYAF
ncbi:MAG: alanine dehydrogenase, partial [Saprospiraceae bacterium]